MMSRPATEILVKGTVQGVGFRPFVYRLAHQLSLVGHVSNSGNGVKITVAGTPADIEALIHSLRHQPPPLASINSLSCTETFLLQDTRTFTILSSDTAPASSTHVPPDIAACAECLREITDPDDHRCGYPFTNCTNCGPRYSIIRTLPYDRSRTTMDVFPMCPRCTAEYEDPLNRRFHAQPNACPDCGPELSWEDNTPDAHRKGDALDKAIRSLNAGSIIGIKGLGGFHLAADAFSPAAVDTLRRRKGRPAKPLAVMISDVTTARQLCRITPEAEKLLCSAYAPIILVAKKDSSALAGNLAPGVGELGIMLPYTPLHALLFSHPEAPSCLVMTSGNVGGEPLCRDNQEARERLGSLCDGFLLHNRKIHTRVDDSVVRTIAGKARFIRRSRGFAPAPVSLPEIDQPILATGGELKNCFCLARGKDGFMSQHIGDLSNLATLDFFEETYDRLKTLLEIEPARVAADLHPDYLSTRFALSLELPVTRVQHHWAHAASVMAEHGLNESLAIILDGTGLGTDGTIWGGEILHCTLQEFKRLGHLSPIALPGGDTAAREPWRMAFSALHSAGIDPDSSFPGRSAIDSQARTVVAEMLEKDVNCPLTSSCGRLFDAVSSLLGICHFNSFEGQAAMELETAASKAIDRGQTVYSMMRGDLDFSELIEREGDVTTISVPAFIRMLHSQSATGSVTTAELALFFHQFLVSSFGNVLLYLSRQTGIDSVVLSGGCIQNRILTEGLVDLFSHTHLKLYTNVQVPANDGGLALGQAVIGGLHVPGDPHAGD